MTTENEGPKFCPTCGSSLLPHNSFCSSCGNQVHGLAEDAQVQSKTDVLDEKAQPVPPPGLSGHRKYPRALVIVLGVLLIALIFVVSIIYIAPPPSNPSNKDSTSAETQVVPPEASAALENWLPILEERPSGYQAKEERRQRLKKYGPDESGVIESNVLSDGEVISKYEVDFKVEMTIEYPVNPAVNVTEPITRHSEQWNVKVCWSKDTGWRVLGRPEVLNSTPREPVQ